MLDLIAPADEQRPPGGRVQLPHPRQQLRPGHSRQPLVSQHESDLAPVVAELAKDINRLFSGPGRDDLVVSPVPLTQLGLDAVARSRAVGQQHYRLRHQDPDLGTALILAVNWATAWLTAADLMDSNISKSWCAPGSSA